MIPRLAAVVLFALNAVAAPLALRPEVPVSPPVYTAQNFASDPRIATDGNDYLIVWTDYRTGGEPSVYAARMRADGTVIDRLGLRIAVGAHAGPVIWTGSHYLIAYDVEPAAETYVRTMTQDAVFGEPIEIGSRGSRFGAMATNGTNALIATGLDVLLLDLDGHKLKKVPLALPVPDNTFSFSRIAAAGSNYLLVVPRRATARIISAEGVAGPAQALAGEGVYTRPGLATDGENFLVAWATNRIEGQLLDNDGTPAGPVRVITSMAHSDYPSVVWRDGEYFVVFNNQENITLYRQRVGRNGQPLGDPKTIKRIGLQPGLQLLANGGTGVFLFEDLQAAFFDDASLASSEPFHKVVSIPMSARPQSNVHLARLGSDGYVAAWEEQGGGIFVSTAAGTTPVPVTGGYGQLIDVLVDGETIWVLFGSSHVGVMRFTRTLERIDPVPLYFEVAGEVHGTAAAGNGVIALAYEVAGIGPTSEDASDVAALLLRPVAGGIERKDVRLSIADFADHTAAVAFDGSAFVYGWVHAKGAYPEWGSAEPMPGHEIVATRISPEGRVLDAAPSVVATMPSIVRRLEAARGANGVAFSWLQEPAKTLQLALFPGGAVHDFGDAKDFGAFEPHDGGFLLVRGNARRTPELTEVEYLFLGSDLSLRSSGALPPYEADGYWKPFDIDVIGNGDPVFAYGKIANGGTYGHVSRIFIRGTGDERTRRRAVR